ncbi:unnamed protein product [Penicillium nalgiovense]|nr:unnamed protein product [Penicillium nalgiovense]
MVPNTSSAIRTKSAPIDAYSAALFNFVIFALNSSLTKIPRRIIANAISTTSTPDVVAKSTLLNHINEHLGSADSSAAVFCPYPCCEERKYVDNLHLQWHFFDAHSIEEPRSNCVKRKRKWQLQSEPAGTTFGNLSDETLPSLEDYFLTSTLPTSFEDSDMTSADDLIMEFIRLDND